MERGVPFAAPPADSIPCVQARQEPYPPRYLSSGDRFFSRMSAETRSMICTTLNVGLEEMTEAWKRVKLHLDDEIKERVRIRDASFDTLTKLYQKDMETVNILAGAYSIDSPEERRKIVEGSEMPRFNDLGFRMWAIKWDSVEVDFDHCAVERTAIILSETTTFGETNGGHGSSVASESEDSTAISPSVTETERNTVSLRSSYSSNPTVGRSGTTKNSTRSPDPEQEEEVF